MTTEVIRYKIPAEQAEAFEQSYHKAESILRNSKHCLGYRLLRGVEEPETGFSCCNGILWKDTKVVFARSRSSTLFSIS